MLSSLRGPKPSKPLKCLDRDATTCKARRHSQAAVSPLERRSPWQCWTAVAVLSVCLLVGAAELLLRTALGCATTLCLTQTSGLKLQPGSPHSLLTGERRHSLVRLASDSCQQGQH